MIDIVSKNYIQKAIDALKGRKGEEIRLPILENLLDTAAARTEKTQRDRLTAKRKARGQALLHRDPVFGGTHA